MKLIKVKYGNKKIHFLTCLFVVFWTFTATAQTKISGNIKNEKGENLSAVLVALLQVTDSSIVSYAYSNVAGNYTLNTENKKSEFLLKIDGLTVVAQTRKIKNVSQTQNFVVAEKEISLKEVIVKPEKITYTKDTLNYLVSAFASDKDYAIGDVLKKMPGIEVFESGNIRYQGVDINKFYIENMDLLQGRYGIATNNIRAKDVSTVQVLENHQPIKAMDSVRISNKAAINLKLKEDAKGTLSILAQAGAGVSPFLWNEELTTMFFGKTFQNISTYKTNNTGNDLSKELRSFTNNYDIGTTQITNIQTPVPPNINQNRYLFNNSHAVTLNNIKSLGKEKDKTLNFNLIYYHDLETRNSNEYSSYFIEKDSTLKINEIINSRAKTDRLETEIRYNQNANNRYINNYINIAGNWEHDTGDIFNPFNINQKLARKSVKASNAFTLIKSKGEKGFELYSQIGFVSTPQNLTVTPALYTHLLNNGNDFAKIRQNAQINSLATDNQISLLSAIKIGNIRINPMARVRVKVDFLTSELFPANEQGNAVAIPPDSLKNNLLRTEIAPSLGFGTDYKIGKLKINARLPITYHYFNLTNKIYSIENKDLQKLYFEPSVNVQYALNQRFEFNAEYFNILQTNSIDELYSGFLLQSYRNINRFDSRFATYRTNSISFSVSYKNIFKMLFINGQITYNNLKSNVLYVQNFSENLMLTSFAEKPNSRKITNIAGKISKGFDFWRLITGLNLSYTTSSSQQIRQENIVNGQNDFYNIAFNLSAVPLSVFNFSINSTWQQSRFAIENEQKYPIINTLANELTLDFTLFKNASLGTRFEQYYNGAEKKVMYFGDILLTYSLKQIRFELSYNNIFNTKHYTTTFYSDLNEYRYNYTIRPANVVLKVRFKIK
ncbi:MAG: hypothetical protein LBS01_09875 [Prevotellaceae bacterium]|jgi:hypothetical protein|nr:hypothetical protein [Prevotellaceae bacterium]